MQRAKEHVCPCEGARNQLTSPGIAISKITIWRLIHMNRDNEPANPMTAENVEQFDVWIFDSSELVVSVIPIDAPWNAKAESYALTEQA
jgi:hypothetical protein